MDANLRYVEKAWLRAILNKSWRQHPTKQLYGHLPPITKTIQVRRNRHAGHYWRIRDELICDILPWIPSHGRAKAGRPTSTYIQKLCADTGCNLEDLLEVIDDSEGWQERVRDIRANGVTWWWWWCNCLEKTELRIVYRRLFRKRDYKSFISNEL